jgi:hypothetical protein
MKTILSGDDLSDRIRGVMIKQLRFPISVAGILFVSH